MVADLGIDQSVTYEVSPRLGTSDAQLLDLYNAADLVIQPSRCEGFGMMMLGALVAGVPLLSTCNTGHAEFLVERPGQWMPIPTLAESPIAFEKGLVSTLDSELLAESLGFAMTNTAREWMLRRSAMEKPSDWGTWESALPQWVERLKAWTEDT
jgi:glycosyltransferase involved in cell wall biosynthesis